ncbi:MAG: zinc-ribbon domain-containing protein, partial [Anaerolineae bacterium]
MKCPNCGTENREEVRFCRACGHPLPQTPASEATPPPAAEASSQTAASQPTSQTSGIICPTCGATAKFGARFCPRCGNAFQRTRDSGLEGGA